jgi:signal peptidase I
MKLKPKVLKRVLITLIVCIVVVLAFGFRFMGTDGTCMEPTIMDGDFVFCMDAWNVKEGDIVTFLTPELEKWPKNERIWQKRVDHIDPEKGYWLLGDNLDESHDSRAFGYVPWENIHKKVLFIIHTKKENKDEQNL